MNYPHLLRVSIGVALTALLMAGCGSPAARPTPAVIVGTATSQPTSAPPIQSPSPTATTTPTVCLESPASPQCELIGRWESTQPYSADFFENGNLILHRLAIYASGDYEWLNENTIQIKLPDGQGGYVYYNAVLSDHSLTLSGHGISIPFTKPTQ